MRGVCIEKDQSAKRDWVCQCREESGVFVHESGSWVRERGSIGVCQCGVCVEKDPPCVYQREGGVRDDGSTLFHDSVGVQVECVVGMGRDAFATFFGRSVVSRKHWESCG